MAEGTLERAIPLDAHRIIRRPHAVVTGQDVIERHVLARHMTADATRARAAWIMVGVGAHRFRADVLGMAPLADGIAGRPLQGGHPPLVVRRVWIMAGDAAHGARTAAEEQVSRFTRIDVAASRIVLACGAL